MPLYPRRSVSGRARPVRRNSLRGYGAYDASRGERYYKAYKKSKPQRAARARRSFTSYMGKALAPAVGAAATALGGPLAGALGSGLASMISKKLTGFGDYHVKKNVFLEETNGPPRVVNRGHEFVFRHREFLTDVYSGTGPANGVSGFNVQTFPINPGQFNTFPWLSRIAAQFEQYRIEGMVFEYKSMFSDAVVTANGALGNIILATEYNAGQPPFQSKQAMENYEYAQSCKPSCSVLHPIECARKLSVLTEQYIRTGAVPAGEDEKTYDFGDFQIATTGIPLGAAGAAVNLGELWVSYQFVFLKPKIPTSGAVYTDSGWFHQSGSSTLTLTAASPLAPVNAGTISSSSNLGVIVGLNTLQIPLLSYPMNYLVTLNYQDATQATNWYWNGSPVTATTNGVILSTVLKAQQGASQFWTSGTAVNTQGLSASFVVSANQASGVNQYCSMTFRNITSSGTGTDTINADILINAVPVNVN